MKKTLPAAFFAALLAISPLGAQSGVPLELSYQATVTDDAGALIAPTTPANYEITVRIWDAAADGTLLWSEKQGAPVFKGRFSIVLGQGAAVLIGGGEEPRPELHTILNEAARFTEVTLKSLDDVGAVPTTFLPRQKLVATATALRARVAETLINGAITEAAIPARSLSGEILANGAINSRAIAANAITVDKLVPNSITAAQLGPDSVGASELADGAVDTAAIQNGAVTSAKLAQQSVGTVAIENGSILQYDIADNAVLSSHIKDNTVTGRDILNGTIESIDIATGSMIGSDMADNTIPSTKLAAGVGAIHMSSSTNTKFVHGGDLTSSGKIVTFTASSYGIPTSGVDGAILKVVVVNNSGTDGAAVIFWGSNYIFPQAINTTPPWLCNSAFSGSGASNIGGGQIFCPLKNKGGGKYEFQMKSYKPTSWSGANSTVYVSIIGYY